MKTIEGKIIYKCDFCKKKLFIKSAMERHEKYCSMNPVNFKACSGCVLLKEESYEYDGGYDYNGETVYRSAAAFKCTKLDQLLYPTKAERLGLPEKYPDQFENQKPMPKECEHKQFYF